MDLVHDLWQVLLGQRSCGSPRAAVQQSPLEPVTASSGAAVRGASSVLVGAQVEVGVTMIRTALEIPAALQVAGADAWCAAGRIPAVASCISVASLAAPPVIGLLGEAVPVQAALLLATPCWAVVLLLAGLTEHGLANGGPGALDLADKAGRR